MGSSSSCCCSSPADSHRGADTLARARLHAHPVPTASQLETLDSLIPQVSTFRHNRAQSREEEDTPSEDAEDRQQLSHKRQQENRISNLSLISWSTGSRPQNPLMPDRRPSAAGQTSSDLARSLESHSRGNLSSATVMSHPESSAPSTPGGQMCIPTSTQAPRPVQHIVVTDAPLMVVQPLPAPRHREDSSTSVPDDASAEGEISFRDMGGELAVEPERGAVFSVPSASERVQRTPRGTRGAERLQMLEATPPGETVVASPSRSSNTPRFRSVTDSFGLYPSDEDGGGLIGRRLEPSTPDTMDTSFGDVLPSREEREDLSFSLLRELH